MEQLEGQRNIFDVISDFEVVEAGDFDSYRKCEFCVYYKNTFNSKLKKCVWDNKAYSDNCWKPYAYIIPKLCSNCLYGNSFIKKTNCCTHPKGSCNRRCAYPDKKDNSYLESGWHWQKELDTCDNWAERHRKW